MSPFFPIQLLAVEVGRYLPQFLAWVRVAGHNLVALDRKIQGHGVFHDCRPKLSRLGNVARFLLKIEGLIGSGLFLAIGVSPRGYPRDRGQQKNKQTERFHRKPPCRRNQRLNLRWEDSRPDAAYCKPSLPGMKDKAEDWRLKTEGRQTKGFRRIEVGFPLQSTSRHEPTAYSLQSPALAQHLRESAFSEVLSFSR